MVRREAPLALLGGYVLAALMFWPLPLHMGSEVPKELADPLLQAWQVAWGGHALATQPFDLFQANLFYPLKNTLAFSDALVGLSPAGLVGEGVGAAVLRYNLLFLFAYALAFAGTYLLARELGLGRGASVLAGVAFAFAPWRLEQDNHLHVISSGGIPLALALLVRGYRHARPGVVVAGFAVAAWQVTIGFTLGLPLLYGFALAAAGAAVVWIRRGRPAPERRMAAATAVGAVLLVGTAGGLALPYLEVLDDHPESRRTTADLERFSPPLSAFAAAPAENLVWSRPSAPVRDRLPWSVEQTLFPGLAILALALFGLVKAPLSRRTRIGLGVGVLVAAAFSMGVRFLDGQVTYRLLYEYAPGWQGIRTPGRLNTFTSLGLALLAAGGGAGLMGRVRAGRAAALAVALCAIVLVEGSGFAVGREGRPTPSGPITMEVPDPPPGQGRAGGPRLHLPFTSFELSFPYMIWSTESGFPEIVNGISGFYPRYHEGLERRVRGFPDQPSVDLLREIGVRSVVLHPGAVSATPWKEWRARGVEALAGVTREEGGGVVVYRLGDRSQTRDPSGRSSASR